MVDEEIEVQINNKVVKAKLLVYEVFEKGLKTENGLLKEMAIYVHHDVEKNAYFIFTASFYSELKSPIVTLFAIVDKLDEEFIKFLKNLLRKFKR